MKKPKNIQNWNIIFLFSTLTASLGAIGYLAYNLNAKICLLVILLSISITAILAKKFNWHLGFQTIARHSRRESLELSIYGLLWLSNLWLLLSAVTDKAIISPWQSVSAWWFMSIAALIACNIYLAYKNHPLHQVVTRASYFIILSVAALVYKINYGFDPFIHQASEKYINDFGAITPKTLYYSSQYSFIVILHKLTGASIAMLDKWLLPASAALILPKLFEGIAKKAFSDSSAARLLPLVVGILPFSIFIVTVPQAMAYLLAICAVTIAFTATKTEHWILAGSALLAACLAQPIAGLPAVFVAVTILIHKSDIKHKEFFYAASLALNTVSIPAVFYWMERAHFSALTFLTNFLDSLATLPKFILPNDESLGLSFIYSFGFNQSWLLIALISISCFYLWSKRQKAELEIYCLYFAHGLALFLAFLLTKALNFDYLIAYEKSNYADRLLVMSFISFIPLMAITLYELVKRSLTMSRNWRIGLGLLLTLLVTANIYLSYPHKDNYENSRGFAVSAGDIAAVNWINNDAQGEDYTVLANQQVSAAALSQFGFAKYYHNNIFYYPIPTGSQLYEYYLNMNKKASRDNALDALEYVGAKKLYFVVNRYWWSADKIIGEAKYSANRWISLDDGQTLVFVYETNSANLSK